MNHRIDQILPTITYGDAISNHTISMMKFLRRIGVKSDIFAENINPKVSNLVKHISNYKVKNKNDVVIYHMSTGTKLSYFMRELKSVTKIINYHNITPARYFKDYDNLNYKLLENGRLQLEMLSNSFDYAIADSEYNRKELITYNYNNIDVLPIFISYDDYKKAPDNEIIKKYNDGKINIIFVGRIAPNKKQEDIIKTFYYYKKYINKDSRLFLVGSYTSMEIYYNSLISLVKKLNLTDVYFTGHIPFEQILAYYRVAKVFLCMSEHEGFCVPLIESMFFEVPIIAYKSSAIPYTLKDAGVLIKNKDYYISAQMIDEIVNNKNFRGQLIRKQNERMQDFTNQKIEGMYKEYIERFLGDIDG